MKHDFNEHIDRRGTNSLKYDFATERGKPDDVMPLWVADMDFRTPPAVIDAMIEASKHGIFGYSDVKLPYFQTLHSWYLKRFQWNTEASWLVKTPGVVFAICTAIRAFTVPGDRILIQRPVYYPFTDAILDNDRVLVNNPLVYHNGRYTIDLDDFEAKIRENHVKIFILCNPHNPVGRVWSREELTGMGDICLKYDVKIIADEIHEDFIFPGFRHTVFASLRSEYAAQTITCTAPSKTFNLAGLQVSNIFISNREMRHAFRKAMLQTGYAQLNTMGLVACQAAYEKGEDWLNELRSYLDDNLAFARTYLKEELPQISLVEPEGTYLLWLDFKSLDMTEEDLEHLIVDEAKLWLDKGTMFGPEGEGFQRINMACPRATLEQAFTQLKHAMVRIRR